VLRDFVNVSFIALQLVDRAGYEQPSPPKKKYFANVLCFVSHRAVWRLR